MARGGQPVAPGVSVPHAVIATQRFTTSVWVTPTGGLPQHCAAVVAEGGIALSPFDAAPPLLLPYAAVASVTSQLMAENSGAKRGEAATGGAAAVCIGVRQGQPCAWRGEGGG
jgi:hypothetical protein